MVGPDAAFAAADFFQLTADDSVKTAGLRVRGASLCDAGWLHVCLHFGFSAGLELQFTIRKRSSCTFGGMHSCRQGSLFLQRLFSVRPCPQLQEVSTEASLRAALITVRDLLSANEKLQILDCVFLVRPARLQ